MFELIAAGIGGTAAVLGHLKSRSFVRRRLRFTRAVEKPWLGVAAGVASAVVAAPIVALLPIVGAGTALVFGAGVGTGVALGSRDAREGKLDDDE